MKTEKIIWGLIFIFVGSVFMLDNFDVIDFYWGSVWRFWPIIFILIGANMLLSRLADKNTGAILAASVTVLVLVFIGYQGSTSHSGRGWMHFEFDKDKRNKDADWKAVSSFSEPYTGAKAATLTIQGGATVYKLTDTTTSLFQADVKEPYGGYTLNKTTLDSVEVLNFRKRNQRGDGFRMDDMEANETHMRLNAAPVWDITVEMGAGETNFDLQNFKIRNLRFEGGAASFQAKIGSKVPLTDVHVETGVASVEIEVPETSGCRILVDSGLSSKDFNGFVKQADGSYETSNFDTAVNKINISLKGGLSSFEVRKY
ncbi:MAG: LiaF transmembrane domain-containing protein [Daejeonella sp.]